MLPFWCSSGFDAVDHVGYQRLAVGLPAEEHGFFETEWWGVAGCERRPGFGTFVVSFQQFVYHQALVGLQLGWCEEIVGRGVFCRCEVCGLEKVGDVQVGEE